MLSIGKTTRLLINININPLIQAVPRTRVNFIRLRLDVSIIDILFRVFDVMVAPNLYGDILS